MYRRISTLALALALVVGLASPAAAADGDHDGVPDGQDRCPTITASRIDGCPIGRWRLRDSNSAGPAHYRLDWGSLAWTPVAGDWLGAGYDSVGAVDRRNGIWRLRLDVCPCAPHVTIRYTAPATGPQFPVVGDWDGDGIDTLGIYTPATGTWHLRNTPSAGPPEVTFQFGGVQPGAQVRPVAGDWNGDGTDTVGIYRRDNDQWRLRNSNTTGPASLVFTFGRAGRKDLPVVGDWDGNGTDTVGLMEEEGIFYRLRNANSAGPPDIQFSFVTGRRAVVAGDWDGDGDASIGVRRR
jgi:hypothetical protein